jgi:hypothetical protein
MKHFDLPWFIAISGLGLAVGLVVALTSPLPSPPVEPAPPPAALVPIDPPPVPTPPETLPEPPATEPRPVIELAFVLDTTGSMGGLLQGAKERIWSIASRLARGQPRPDLRVALVGFRDQQDAYVTRSTDFTTDMDQVHADLMRFTAQGGGDTPEAIADALRAAHDLQWSQGQDVLRLVYLVGDAPAKPVPNGTSAQGWARRLRQRGIVVGTVQCGQLAGTRREFQALAQTGGGTYIKVRQDGGMASVDTPYDEEIGRLEREALGLATFGGGASARSKARSKVDHAAKLGAKTLADRAGYYARAPAPAPEGAVDLAAEPEALDELAEEALPEELRPLSPVQRKAEVQARAKRAKDLRRRVEKLVDARERWIETQRAARAGDDAGLDDKLMDDVTGRAARIGVAY